MPSEYELGTASGGEQGIAVGEFTLADGTVSLILPKHWVLQREDFRSAHFAIPELQDATLTVEVEIFDNPAAIAANDLLDYVSHPAFPPLADDALDHVRDGNGKPDFEKLTVRARGTTRGPDGTGDDHEAVRIWRKLGLHRPNFIRVLEAQLSVAEEEAGSGAAQEAEDIVDHLLKFARFADHETAADRFAPNAALRQESLWDTIGLRVPADWPDAERENDDGTGMYVFDDKQADRWTLWIDFDVYSHGKGEAALDAARFAAELAESMKKDRDRVIDVAHDPMPDHPDEAVAKVVYGSVENGARLRHVSWHKVAIRGSKIIIAHFTLVVPETIVDDSDIMALTALLERECRNAVLVDRDVNALQRPTAGNA